MTVVRDQQVPMARWVRDHLPDDARVGVHDVGLVRYFGDRALYDVVGPDYTRTGRRRGGRDPAQSSTHGAQRRIARIISPFTRTCRGCATCWMRGVLGEVLAEFPVDLPDHNVAAATGYQAVYRADWSDTRAVEQVAQTTTLAAVAGLDLVDQVDVAHLESEADHDLSLVAG